MSGHGGSTGSILKQPKQVWAVAFASVIAFMGIGLVDPILPVIAADLKASPTATELLFTSYLLITGLAMLVTSWISSRIGAKRTLMIGLALVVVFALAAALSHNVESVIAFRAGWGLGNALFISTALATIVGAASGGTASAIVLYEGSLGLGIAIGPLLGGLLGTVAWQGPFFGTTTLMAIGFIAIAILLRKDSHEPRERTKFSAPIRALAQPALLLLAIASLFYNVGFFVLLAYTPFPLGFGAIGIGLTFFGWGVALAVASVWIGPMLTARLKRRALLVIALPVLALDLVAAGLVTSVPAGLVVCVIVGGLMLGVINIVLTESVMEATDLPRAVASSSYSSVRFIGGAIAPPLATVLASALTPSTPYFFAALCLLVSAAIILIGRRALSRIDGSPLPIEVEAAAITAGDVA
ncbi:MAG: transporter, family, multidrug resistance protein [Microbacteriaceae bacterium]|nr:transporter, family, multidrug resistance protein [Microbacteriaceae bacterium]